MPSTSATMASVDEAKDSAQDSAEVVAKFASDLFGEPLSYEQVINEVLVRVTAVSVEEYERKNGVLMLHTAVALLYVLYLIVLKTWPS